MLNKMDESRQAWFNKHRQEQGVAEQDETRHMQEHADCHCICLFKYLGTRSGDCAQQDAQEQGVADALSYKATTRCCLCSTFSKFLYRFLIKC
uniref:Uncharacterized protein n=1 Tax=Arundo donax TaxID=35708 RepID=A0A0A9GKQ3_ARUDO